MKPSRLLISGAIAVLLIVLSAVGLLSTPAFQTWIVNRRLAAHPDLHVTIGRISAGLHHLRIDGMTYEHAGVRLRAPRIEAELPLLSAVFSGRLEITRLVAKNWTMRVSAGGTTSSPAPPADSGTRAPSTGAAAGRKRGLDPQHAGPFPVLALGQPLPFGLSLDRAELDGSVGLAGSGDRIRVRISGGGLRSGSEGRFGVAAEAVLGRFAVRSLDARGTLTATMDSPRTLSGLALDLDATAAGLGSSPKTEQVRAVAKLARTGDGESYDLAVSKPDRRLLVLHALIPATSGRFAGSWDLDVHDADLVPFSHGFEIPEFTAKGEGRIDFNSGDSQAHVAGWLNAVVGRLGRLGRFGVLFQRLDSVGPLKLEADIDLAQRGKTISVSKLDLTAAPVGGSPVVRAHALQPFEFNPRDATVRPTDATRDVLGLALDRMPLNWIVVHSSDFAFSGGGITGEFVATPRAGGFTFRTIRELSITGVGLAEEGKPLARNLDVGLGLSGDYAPEGWQAHLAGATIRAGNRELIRFDARAGRLAGPEQPMKATGDFTIELPVLLQQPLAGNMAANVLKQGRAHVHFAGSFDRVSEIAAKVSLAGVVARAQPQPAPIPEVTAEIRADIAPDGRCVVNAPILIQSGPRRSDLSVLGTFAPRSEGGAFKAELSSTHLVLDDVNAVVSGWRAVASASSSGKGASAPFWCGFDGTLSLRLARVTCGASLELANVTGTIRVSGGRVDFDQVHAGVGGGAAAGIDGSLTFNPADGPLYAAKVEFTLADFDPGPLLREAEPGRVPPVEGTFTVASRLESSGDRLRDLPRGITGDLELTSKSGTSRILNVSVGHLVENSGKIRSWIASTGNAIKGLAGRKVDYDEITSRSEAANELSRMLNTIHYDQMRIVLVRDGGRKGGVKEFSMISPDVRLSGTGTLGPVDDAAIFDDPVSMVLRLRARGRAAELMKYLGILGADTDELGYTDCTIPVRIGGTVAELDSRDFSDRLIGRAVAKTGILEKAGARALDWIRRLRGK